MKIREKSVCVAIAVQPAGAGPLRGPGGGRSGWSIGTTCGVHGLAREEDLPHAVDDHLVAGLEARLDHEQALDVRPELHVLALCCVLFADDVDVTAILVRQHGLLVDQQRILLRLAEEPHAREEPGREDSVRIRHDGARADRAGRRIERVVDEVHLALVREAFLVRERRRARGCARRASLHGRPRARVSW